MNSFNRFCMTDFKNEPKKLSQTNRISFNNSRDSLKSECISEPSQNSSSFVSVTKPPFYSTALGKVTIVLVALFGLAVIAGGAAGLSYYLGTLSKLTKLILRVSLLFNKLKLDQKVVNNTVYSNTGTLNASFIDSIILSDSEKSALVTLGPNGGFKSFILLYRATRDGFFGNTFHSKCDSKSPTVILIKSNLNSVFGGYTAALWNPSGYKYDATAFLYSLRRRGFNSTEKFPIQSPSYALYVPSANSMPIFGLGYELFLCDSSDIIQSSYTSCSGYYSCPSGGNTHLAGSYNFFTTEIEVFQVAI